MKKFLIVICLMIGIGIVCEFGFNSYNPYETKCVEAGCNNDRVEAVVVEVRLVEGILLERLMLFLVEPVVLYITHHLFHLQVLVVLL